MSAYQGALGRAKESGIVSPDYLVLRFDEYVEPRFAEYLFLSHFMVGEMTSLLRGVGSPGLGTVRTPRVNWSDLGQLAIEWPDQREQQQIADYLDAHTANIDVLVEKQERLIGTLAERRQAVISHAVTKGLDPSVQMVDSGDPWLGFVPGHWTISALKRQLSFLTSGSRGWAEYYADSGAPFIRIGNLPRGKLELEMDDTQFVQIPDGAEGSRAVVAEGDVLFSITAYLGSVAIVDSANSGSYVSQHVALARLRMKKVEPRFLGYFVLSEAGQRQLQEQGYGGTKIQLSLEDIKRFVLAMPPLDEQERIAKHLDRETAQMDALSAKAREMIDVLKERRQALISAAVTGKIDVRGLS